VGTDASIPEKTAAAELATYFREVTRAELPVAPHEQVATGPAIAIVPECG
jgi:hypothetical protein